MTFIARDEHPCVKCDTSKCEEHYMWSAKEGETIRLADYGWLDLGAVHHCPPHRIEMERRVAESLDVERRKQEHEHRIQNRWRMLRIAIIAGSVVVSLAVLYFRMFVSHR